MGVHRPPIPFRHADHPLRSLSDIIDPATLIQFRTDQVDRIQFSYSGYDVTVEKNGRY